MTLRSRVRVSLQNAQNRWGFRTLNHRLRAETRSRTRGGAVTAVALLASAALGACGTPSPDLFVVNRDGTVPGAKLTLLVSDQSARCNGAPAKPLTSAQILEARDLLRELIDLQLSKDAIPNAGAAQIFSFEVETEEGKIRYPDRQQRPEVLPRLTRFVRRVAIDTCGLQR
jgi:hypothetical protein